MMLPAPLLAAGRPPATVAGEIDKAIDKALAENKIPVSPRADDAEFIRRVYLDITGRIPVPRDIHEFLEFQLAPLARYPREKLDEWHEEFMRTRIAPIIRAKPSSASVTP